MLKSMRMNLKSLSFTLWLVIFAFIGTTFLVWGIRSTPGGGMARAGIVANVDKDQISMSEYQEAYRNLYEHYRKTLGDKFDDQTAERMKLKQKVLDDLISQRLIQIQARKMNVRVTEGELAETIKNHPAFAEDGQFSRKRYLALLEYNRLSPQQYERTLELEILLTKVQDLIKDAAKVSDAEAKDLYYLASNRVKVEYLELPSKEFKKEQVESIASKMQGKEGWTRVAAEIKVKPRTTGYLAYNLPFMEVPDPVPFIKTAFSLKQGEVSSPVEGKDRYYVLRLIEIGPVSDKMFQSPQKELLKGQILVEKRDRLLKEWLEGVKRNCNIQIEESLIQG
jgi:parvulin-like peptidyl-prolyl isomerase